MSKLHKAERKRAKLRVGLVGPSGSGKTYSALLLANGIAPWEKIAIIDTKNGSGELCAHLGNYLAYTITDNFVPENISKLLKSVSKQE
jgi:adenylate kinase family enzyme